MTIVYSTTLLLLSIYGILLAYYHRSFKKMPENETVPSGFIPTTPITVVVPARNEAANIKSCIQSILAQEYPQELLQCIIIDDHSEDNTATIVNQITDPRLRLVSLEKEFLTGATNAYKKKAIETGISLATGELIVTTDADCIAGPKWLKTIVYCYQKNGAVLIAGPVKMKRENGALQLFQSLDFMSLQGITAASVYSGFHSMCNGANLAYTKKAFHSVEGFKGIDALASGDDMLLMHKIARQFPGKIHYLKSQAAIVSTEPAKSLKAFLQQRIRWASKAQAYEDKSVFRVLLLVYIMNLLMLLLMVMAFFSVQQVLWLLLFLFIKTGVEWPFMHSITAFYQEKRLLKFFPLFQPFHILYTVLAGSFGQFGTYEWKGRRVR